MLSTQLNNAQCEHFVNHTDTLVGSERTRSACRVTRTFTLLLPSVTLMAIYFSLSSVMLRKFNLRSFKHKHNRMYNWSNMLCDIVSTCRASIKRRKRSHFMLDKWSLFCMKGCVAFSSFQAPTFSTFLVPRSLVPHESV